eukprot:gene23573-9098_t
MRLSHLPGAGATSRSTLHARTNRVSLVCHASSIATNSNGRGLALSYSSAAPGMASASVVGRGPSCIGPVRAGRPGRKSVAAQAFFKMFRSDPAENTRKKYQARVNEINALEEGMQALSDAELAAKTPEFKQRIANGEGLESLLPEAFAVVREASKRVLGLRPFDVQLMGGMILHEGQIAEMRTGEGKTLVAVLPAYLNALSGKGVHVVTVNDYLARRDSEVGLVQTELKPDERREAYNCDITYVTNSELGFDYLRDNLAAVQAELVLRTASPFNFCIIDEWASFIINAVKAKELQIKNVNYIVKAGEIIIVDEFTGRSMPGRRWSDGLHQPGCNEEINDSNESTHLTLRSVS